MQIHLDLVGGLSGDMFIGAILDCFPSLAESLPGILEAGGFNDLVTLQMEPHNDGTLTGTRFKVIPATDAESHHHRHHSEIVSIIEASSLDDAVKARALAIFEALADAEAKVHGIDISRVAFHEVGAWDSIADVVCAAYLIESVDADAWSASSIPLGSGRIRTAHGLLPVPAPATALLLEGFKCHDDGVEGERVTPTGAAILKNLSPSQGSRRHGTSLIKSGHGFGTKVFDQVPNVARALVFDHASEQEWEEDSVTLLAFEVDDQPPEELASALDRIREIAGVLDVSQHMVFGKKGRQMMGVQIITNPDAQREVTRACFTETTTLGVRQESVSRAVLRREHRTVDFGGETWHVKVTYRPNGITAKLEQDEVARIPGDYRTRLKTRRAIEDAAAREAEAHDAD